MSSAVYSPSNNELDVEEDYRHGTIRHDSPYNSTNEFDEDHQHKKLPARSQTSDLFESFSNEHKSSTNHNSFDDNDCRRRNNELDPSERTEPTPIGPSASLQVVDNVSAFSGSVMSHHRELLELLAPTMQDPQVESDLTMTISVDPTPLGSPSTITVVDQIATLSDCVLAHTMDLLEILTPLSKGSSHYKHYQSEVWYERYNELLEYKAMYGNCKVPHNWKGNKKLAQWVKRQRYQYKLMRKGKHSTMSLDRFALLERIGFAWYAHGLFWE